MADSANSRDEIIRRDTTPSEETIEDVDRPAEYSDVALALRFTARHKSDLKFVNSWGRWLIWNGQRWQPDETLRVFDLSRRIAREASAEIVKHKGSARLAFAVANSKTVAAIERLARSDRHHAGRIEDWDADPWVLNTPGGAVDLRTGLMQPHDRADRITKITSVTPGGECPLWLAFLDHVFKSDKELIAFIRRMLGYSLTGSNRDHALFFLYGTGGNGKGVFLNTWHSILGDYSTIPANETFTASKVERHPTDVAMLRGARAVIAQETEYGQHWAESRIKQLTGGDAISARFMRQDYFTFQPTFKLMIAGNHKPSVRNVDEAMRRRLNLVPFMVTIPKTDQDPELLAKLKAESPGILAWAIEGCREWQRIGLAQPPAVRDATDGYLADEDAIGRFLKEYCVLDEPEALEEVRDLFAAWQRWCVVTGEFAGKLKKFSQALDSRNLVRVNHPVSRRAAFARVRLLLKFDALMGPQPGIIVANRLAVANSPPVGPIDLADSRPPTERDD